MNMAFDPVVALKLPWAAVLGNHDQESSLSREDVMRHITAMPYTLSRLNPDDGSEIDSYGNYNIEISGPEGSPLVNKSVLNLYFLDSGDYSTVQSINGYSWIKLSQQKVYKSAPHEQKESAPGLVYFHIPVPEYASFDSNSTKFIGVKHEPISNASINSGFFTTMVEAGDVKAVFTGHDHLNDFCGELTGIQLCYAGGFGYHAYGKAGWPRRARVVSAFLEKTADGQWGGVKSIKSWKRLDDQYLSTIDSQVLWSW
ncbi:Purple acid phosphatase 29 [Rhynchospora pubera]|uniref:Purple acid phosphatase 29 n=1 Tax=Rhynchospora pubera TaxID=906938 RepID=A0AAV8E5M3_9POAL|nr:Purple acid phosphatase 29 [Rhynchospora pubera]